jgi:hypothetical protein
MAKRLNIPDEHQDVYQQLLRLLPYELRNDTDVHNIISVYLKFGGEKLARQGIAIIIGRYMDEIEENEEEAQDSNSLNSEVDEAEDLNSDDDTGVEDSDNDE